MQVAEIMEKFNINADVTVEQNESSEELLLLPETVEAVAAYQEIPQKKEGQHTVIQKFAYIVSGQESSSVAAMTVKDTNGKSMVVVESMFAQNGISTRRLEIGRYQTGTVMNLPLTALT